MKILIAGAHGFIGKAVSKAFLKEGWEVASLVRNKKEKGIYWNPEKGEIDAQSLRGFDTVINLAGESIFGLWTPSKIKRIRHSRLKSTSLLCNALAQCSAPPSLYLGASAVGYYGERGEETMTELSAPGHGVLPSICKNWEKIPYDYLKETRIAHMRFGVVLGEEGPLKKMASAYRWGGGVIFGTGRQWFPWIAVDDVVDGMLWIKKKPSLAGPFNFVAPELLRQIEWSKQLAAYLHRPCFLRIPAPFLKILLGKGSEVFLAGAAAIPEKLMHSSFQFTLPNLDAALKKYLPINERR